MKLLSVFALSCTVAATVLLVAAHTSSSSPSVGPVSEWEKVISPTYRHLTSGQRDVLCPTEKKAFGGGYHIVGGGQSLGFAGGGLFYVTINRPTDDGGGWRVAWYASPQGVKRFYMNLYALCAKA